VLGPLNWEEFSRDTIVASHFSHQVGVYSLEGCVRQGFLPRLETMDWNQGVEIPAAALARMHRFRAVVQGILWTASHLLYFVAAFLIAVACWCGVVFAENTHHKSLLRHDVCRFIQDGR
jgi:hypothetical protein